MSGDTIHRDRSGPLMFHGAIRILSLILRAKLCFPAGHTEGCAQKERLVIDLRGLSMGLIES